jgi:hypothetical protein
MFAIRPLSDSDPFCGCKNSLIRLAREAPKGTDLKPVFRCWLMLLRAGGWFVDHNHQAGFAGLLQVRCAGYN